mmetsp:Transcript_32028/g.68536  ORF Transcript_32028/g.68536 Transcript_32028/m.68536 type:complete len:208 (-) Transcript_32028:1523-2146(-)
MTQFPETRTVLPRSCSKCCATQIVPFCICVVNFGLPDSVGIAKSSRNKTSIRRYSETSRAVPVPTVKLPCRLLGSQTMLLLADTSCSSSSSSSPPSCLATTARSPSATQPEEQPPQAMRMSHCWYLCPCCFIAWSTSRSERDATQETPHETSRTKVLFPKFQMEMMPSPPPAKSKPSSTWESTRQSARMALALGLPLAEPLAGADKT